MLIINNNSNKIKKSPSRIPEIGEDLPNKNPFIQADGLPNFKNVTIENCLTKIGRQSMEVEKAVQDAEHFINLKYAQNKAITLTEFFENIHNPLEQTEIQLQTTWGLAKTLYLSNTSLMPPKSYVIMHQRANRAQTAKYNSKPIYKAVCELKQRADPRELTSEQDRLLNKFILEGKLNGVNLSKDKKEDLSYQLIKLSEEKILFQSKVNVAIDRFSHTITDYSDIRSFPPKVLQAMSVDPKNHLSGPWTVTLRPNIYNAFMEYCPDRLMRWNLWQANTRKASKLTDRELDTGVQILRIRDFRKEQASLLGYKNYTEMQMETKMAGSFPKAKQFITDLLAHARPTQTKELKKLFDFAEKSGFSGKYLEEYDVAYWKRKYILSACKYDENLIQEFFPLTKVLSSTFDLCEKLFNIKITERAGNVSTWSNNVRFYEIFDLNKSALESGSGTPIAGVYLDLNSNSHENSSGFTVAIRDKCTLTNSTPLASIIFSFSTPLYGKPCLLSVQEAKCLFSKFGHTLRLLLTEANYRELSGHTNIEWDVVEVCENVFTNLFYDPDVLKSISEHATTQEPLSDNLIETIQADRLTLQGYRLCNELFKSHLDLELFLGDEFYLDIVRRLWPNYHHFALDKYDARVCSMIDIITSEWSAGYYSHLWSEMMAADIYHAINEAKKGDNPMDHVKEVGQRFRATFLASGGSRPASEVFRSFRDRDPSLHALVSLLKLEDI